MTDGAHERGRTWAHVEPTIRDQMNATLDAQPESLFEHDGGPVGRTADIILARLVGFDDQVVDDALRLRRVEPEWRTPIPARLSLTPEPFSPDDAILRTARYVLQSGFAEMKLDPTAVPLPPDVKPTPPGFLVTVLFVRYRRRS